MGTIKRECVWRGDIESEISGRDDWVLYIGDHYWALDIDGNMQFYFNPTHFIGMIEKRELPMSVMANMEKECACFDSKMLNEGGQTRYLEPSEYSVEQLDRSMMTGNRFYEQGYTYVTYNGKFYMEISPYNIRQKCDLSQIGADMVRDMLRMTASTRSHYFIQNVFGLSCFRGVYGKDITVMPLEGFRWYSEAWKMTFDEISSDIRRYPMDDRYKSEMRFQRKKVFLHTLFVSEKGYYITKNGNRVELPDSSDMIRNSRFYSTRLSPNEWKEYENTEITVENTDCLIAAKKMLDEGYNPAVLNMASRQKPGGGAYSGAGAQEENLFRRTNLYKSLYQYSDLAFTYGIPKARESYPMDRDFGGIYSPDVTVFRGEEKEGYPLLENCYQVAVISVAGMNRPALDSENRIAQHLVEGVKNKIRTILSIAADNGHDSLVLGALGCGAFRNPPEHIAQLFSEVIEAEYKNKFRKICFAILEDHNSVRKGNTQGNFAPFCKVFGQDG